MSPKDLPEPNHVNHMNYDAQRRQESRGIMPNSEEKDSTPEKSGFSNKQKLIAAMSGIVLLLVVSGAIAFNKSGQKHRVATEVPFTPSETPQTTTETTPSTASTTTPENSADRYSTIMEKYKDMSVDSFEKLPLDERLLYSQYLIDQIVSRGTYDAKYGEGSKGYDYIINPTTVSSDNNGQEIVNGFQYAQQMSELQYTVGPAPDFLAQYDVSDGQKVLSSAYFTVGDDKLVSKDYLVNKTHREELSQPTFIKERVTATNTSDLLDSNDGKTQYKIVTYNNTEIKTYYARFVYHEFTDYKGTRKAIWLLDTQSADSLETLNKQTTIR